MKITLIQCPAWGTYEPPMSIAQLSACLKKDGHTVFVFDLNIQLYLKRSANYQNMWAWEQCDFWHNPNHVERFFSDNQGIIDRYAMEILKSDPGLVCFSVSSSSRFSSLILAKKLKERHPDLLVLFGGTLFFDKKYIELTLREGCVDIVIPGEGENTLCELADFLDSGKDLNYCKGLVYKKDGCLVDTGERPLMNNLDILPFLDFESLPLKNYDDSQHIALMASRGCILRCVFCSSREFWPGYRVMSAERIFEEVKFHRARNDYLGHVNFLDLVFNGNMRTLNTFCELMIKADFSYPVYWTANVIIRPEMTADVLNKMSQAGCEHLIYGIESGSQRVLDLMRKKYRISDADNVIRATHEAGIRVTGNFMFGFPGETEEDFQMTLDFIKINAKYLDRVYPSRTYCAIEEPSYLASHLLKFNIKLKPPNHLYWESIDGKNTYPVRLERCEEFSSLAKSLGIEVGCGVQTSVELDRWFNLGHYYENKGDSEKARECFLKYYDLDAKNEVVLNKIKCYTDAAK